MRQIDKVPDHCFLTSETVFNTDGTSEHVLRAKPETVSNIVTVKQLGGMTEVDLHCIGVDKGVNTHDVHDFNVASGFLPADEDTAEERTLESKRVSESRLRKTVRELAACNPWDFFVTITLSPELWDRDHPEKLQSSIMNDFRSWSRKQINNLRPYRNCAYLLIPELHDKGGVHLHGFIHNVPSEEIVPYTMDDVLSPVPLPYYICSEVKAGREINHLRLWDIKYGYNMLLPIGDSDRAANYATKYITKSLDTTVFRTRIWHSRGLMRAKPRAVFQLPFGEHFLDEYKEYMRAIAAITPNGVTLQKEYYRPDENSDNSPVAGINTLVDRDTMSTEDVIHYLGMEYPRIDKQQRI